ncbi:hypothetical protein ACFL0D_03865 [Thermoproteota archaeon]
MTSNIQEQEMRRLDIIDGINRGIAYTKIAARLGVPIRVVKRDLQRMKCNRDSKLKQAYSYAREQAQVKKQLIADLPNQRFHSMTGMTFKEKTFSNMMSFYGPELREILKAENEREAIRDLPSSVRKTLRRNGIIAQVYKSPQITADARTYLTGTPHMNR